MADSYNKKEREKKRRKRKQDKLDKKKQNKIDGVKPMEFMYLDEDGNLSPTPPDPTKKKKEIKLEDIAISVPKKEDSDENMFLRNGVVKFFNHEKGFGFISEATSNEDYFVHIDNLIDPVKEGNKVEFEIGSGPKGPIAIRVKLYTEKPVAPPAAEEEAVEEELVKEEPVAEETASEVKDTPTEE